MYIGIDHGTTALRFAAGDRHFKISRTEARDFSIEDLGRICPLDEIDGIAVCYSMGDGIAAITDIRKVENRGVVSREGAGKHIGGGTKVYDEVEASGIPAVVIPGLHRGSPTDPRFKVYSHQTSPEKLGIAFEVMQTLGPDFIVADVSSNTVSLLVSNGQVVGAFDACVFAPGTTHGALDVDAIRAIDWGQSSANDAFLHAGVDENLSEEDRLPSLALFAAMECASLKLLNHDAKVALAGSKGPVIADEVRSLLGEEIYVYDEWCASKGLSKMAEYVFTKRAGVLGLDLDL